MLPNPEQKKHMINAVERAISATANDYDAAYLSNAKRIIEQMSVNRLCHECLHFDNGRCDFWDSDIPSNWMQIGCDHWEDDIPF